MISYGRQDIEQIDIDTVVDVLRSDYLTQGPLVPKFELAIAQYCDVKHTLAMSNATAALHVACLALELGPGDYLWTSPNTFVASANCAIYCGAEVDFVDIDSRTYNISVDSLEQKLQEAEKVGKLPKIVIPVHFSGQPCDMQKIFTLSKKYGFKVIEDASHAIGGKYLGEPVGNCRFSDITIFSFHPVKIITTGEGGMALTNDEKLADRMRRYRSHGISSEPSKMHKRPDDEIWNYQQIGIGYNYRMTDIQAALGTSQMARLDKYVEKRHTIARRYNEELMSLPLQLPWQNSDSFSSYHLYPVLLKLEGMNKTQRQVYDMMYAAGIQANIHYIPVYRQPFYEAKGFKAGYCPEAENYYHRTISLPMYPTLGSEQQTKVITEVTRILS